jgi:ligand-binding sensor domain-containing protein
VWFATDTGISKFKNDQWTTYTKEDGLSDNNVRSIDQDRSGDIYFCNDGMLTKFGKDSMTTMLPDCEVCNSLYIDSHNIFWFGSRISINKGLYRYDGYQCKKISNKSGIVSHYVTDIEEDRYNNIWVSTLNGVSKITRNIHLSNIFVIEEQPNHTFVGTLAVKADSISSTPVFKLKADSVLEISVILTPRFGHIDPPQILFQRTDMS